MKSYRENPDSHEATEAAKQHEREVFALKMQARQMTPSPLPWKLWKDQDPEQPLEITAPSGDFVCQMHHENTQCEANAELIVRAVNAQEAMIDALRDTWEALDEWACERTPTVEEIARLREQARAAMAICGGEVMSK
jgi:hypothetical protein